MGDRQPRRLPELMNGCRTVVKANGLRFLTRRPCRDAELTVGPQHLQPYGLVTAALRGHGRGRWPALASDRRDAEGQERGGAGEPHLLRPACREGTLHARATPLVRARAHRCGT